jgi:integrase
MTGPAIEGEVVPAGRGELVRRDEPALDRSGLARSPVAPDERPLSDGARALVMSGIPTSTLETYRRTWRPYDAWCEANGLSARPSAESTMIEYLRTWEYLPVHNRCHGGRQSSGDPCTGHRPAPSSMWIWYSSVRFYHSMATPTFAWFGGKKLALAMKGYRETMVNELGWTPNKAPRAWPEHVMAIVDAFDLDDPADVRDRALVLTGWYTGARASDLATYRIGDVAFTPRGVDLTLRASKTNRAVGKVTERRVLRPDSESPRYCGVTAMQAWVAMLRAEYGVTQGALFRPFSKPGQKTGVRALLRGHRDDISYKMSGVSISDAVRDGAIRAGVPDAEYFTEHSLRRGRASHLRTLKVDSLSIGRALGWAGLPPKEYLEEAEAFDDEAPANIGLLG